MSECESVAVRRYIDGSSLLLIEAAGWISRVRVERMDLRRRLKPVLFVIAEGGRRRPCLLLLLHGDGNSVLLECDRHAGQRRGRC